VSLSRFCRSSLSRLHMHAHTHTHAHAKYTQKQSALRVVNLRRMVSPDWRLLLDGASRCSPWFSWACTAATATSRPNAGGRVDGPFRGTAAPVSHNSVCRAGAYTSRATAGFGVEGGHRVSSTAHCSSSPTRPADAVGGPDRTCHSGPRGSADANAVARSQNTFEQRYRVRKARQERVLDAASRGPPCIFRRPEIRSWRAAQSARAELHLRSRQERQCLELGRLLDVLCGGWPAPRGRRRRAGRGGQQKRSERAAGAVEREERAPGGTMRVLEDLRPSCGMWLRRPREN